MIVKLRGGKSKKFGMELEQFFFVFFLKSDTDSSCYNKYKAIKCVKGQGVDSFLWKGHSTVSALVNSVFSL